MWGGVAICKFFICCSYMLSLTSYFDLPTLSKSTLCLSLSILCLLRPFNVFLHLSWPSYISLGLFHDLMSFLTLCLSWPYTSFLTLHLSWLTYIFLDFLTSFLHLDIFTHLSWPYIFLADLTNLTSFLTFLHLPWLSYIFLSSWHLSLRDSTHHCTRWLIQIGLSAPVHRVNSLFYTHVCMMSVFVDCLQHS